MELFRKNRESAEYGDPIENMRRRIILTVLFCLLSLFHAAEAASTDINLPPFLVYTPENEVTGARSHLRILGPLYESYERNGVRVTAFRPLFSWESRQDGRAAADFLWPLSIYRKTRFGTYFWLLPYFNSTGRNQSYEHFLFPCLFLERHKDGRYSWSVFPLYGDLNNFFSYSHFRYILFPLYLHTEKKEVSSNGFCWPLLNVESGPESERFRIFPLYAVSRMDGERENVSILWPLWNSARSLKKDSGDFAFYSFPLGGYESWKELTGFTAFSPFFSYKEIAGRQVTYGILWPFVKYGYSLRENDPQYSLYFWPFWGRSISRNSYYAFFLWPMGLSMDFQTDSKETLWRCFLPFYLSRREYEKNTRRPITAYDHVWPFFSRRSVNGHSMIVGMDPIPVKKLGFFERNYAAFWRLFRVDYNAQGRSFDFLWGFGRGFETKHSGGFAVGPFYSEKHCARTETSVRDIAFGLVKVEKDKKQSRLRLFYCLDFSI